MGMNNALSSGASRAARGFESIADAIMYRWSVERDTWVSTIEVEEARDYLERSGMAVTTTADGRRTAFTALGDLWLSERGALRRLTDDVWVDLDPAFAPDGGSLVFASERSGQFELWLLNDSSQELEDVIVLRIERFDGAVLSEQYFPVRSEPNSAAQLVRGFGWGRVVQPRSTYVTIESERGAFASSHQLFANPRELELPPAELTLDPRVVNERTVDVTLSADSFVLMAAIEHSHPGLHYDDNNLSLHPNRPRTIRVHHPHDSVDPAGFTARIPFEGETFTADACASVD